LILVEYLRPTGLDLLVGGLEGVVTAAAQVERQRDGERDRECGSAGKNADW